LTTLPSNCFQPTSALCTAAAEAERWAAQGGKVLISRCAVVVPLLLIAACGDGDRYEISKEPSGRTVRLDKKTGEIAVIEGHEIKVLKDPKLLEKEKEDQRSLAKPRYWPAIENPNLNVRFTLKTSWRDGEMFYELAFYHIEKTNAEWEVLVADTDEKKKKAKAKLAKYSEALVSAQLNRVATHAPFTVQLFDGDSTKLRDIQVTRLTRIVDGKGLAQAYEYQSSMSISSELYSQLKNFSVQWTSRQ
jgi:hypothetical protein